MAGKSIGHAAQMDAIYAVQRHIYDLTRKYYLLGRDRLISELDVPAGGHVLELGCGTARNIVLASKRYPTAHFYGLDISAEMLKSAAKKALDQGFATRISLACADATNFDAPALFGRETFDRVFCSYTLSMIPGWEQALEQACLHLAPGGKVHVVDFGEQDALPHWFARMLRAWLARFHVEPRAALFDVAEQLAIRHELELDRQTLYRDYARSVVLRKSA
ncbi:methyltransferase [Croceicoccus estronivorus]|uniref:class I SAM-dependent methyltransferase n=1 Tax=Croceicoccus estronivorus TaxID=1172626 RepID=UPI00082A3413|nr:class I SAM-dependent methyltransferase [Croceicoccus estronivorus]OCC23451.1 methyltransferase [Croceicoccus estronivorus]